MGSGGGGEGGGGGDKKAISRTSSLGKVNRIQRTEDRGSSSPQPVKKVGGSVHESFHHSG